MQEDGLYSMENVLADMSENNFRLMFEVIV